MTLGIRSRWKTAFWRMASLAAAVLASTAGSLLPVANAADDGPPLTVPAEVAASALHCTGDMRMGQTPVLFLHGTTSNARSNWSWNWDRALDQRNWAHCDLDLPASGNNDIQYAAEYVVSAIRAMNEASGRKISMVGHSQGGMIGRWALKYWPDTRGMVDDYVGLAASNHGTTRGKEQCESPGGCPAANWQQNQDSHFLAALNTGPQSWPEVNYTEITTHDDEIVDPSTSGWLPAAPNVTNVAVQDLCPAETVDHFGMAYDNAAWLIGLDALTRPGPAQLDQVSAATCGQPLMPSVDPATFPTEAASAMEQTGKSSAEAEKVTSEPPLRPYAK